MNHLDAIALDEPRVGMPCSRHYLFIALHRNQSVGESQRGQQPHHCGIRFYVPFFTVDDEPHRQSVGRWLGRRKRPIDRRGRPSVIGSSP